LIAAGKKFDAIRTRSVWLRRRAAPEEIPEHVGAPARWTRQRRSMSISTIGAAIRSGRITRGDEARLNRRSAADGFYWKIDRWKLMMRCDSFGLDSPSPAGPAIGPARDRGVEASRSVEAIRVAGEQRRRRGCGFMLAWSQMSWPLGDRRWDTPLGDSKRTASGAVEATGIGPPSHSSADERRSPEAILGGGLLHAVVPAASGRAGKSELKHPRPCGARG
jgi:hypothetical protein